MTKHLHCCPAGLWKQSNCYCQTLEAQKKRTKMHRGNLIQGILYAEQSDGEWFKVRTPLASKLAANHLSSYFADLYPLWAIATGTLKKKADSPKQKCQWASLHKYWDTTLLFLVHAVMRIPIPPHHRARKKRIKREIKWRSGSDKR